MKIKTPSLIKTFCEDYKIKLRFLEVIQINEGKLNIEIMTNFYLTWQRFIIRFFDNTRAFTDLQVHQT